MKFSKLIAAVATVASLAALADTEVFRLERDTDTGSLLLVGADEVRRPCCLLSVDEYSMLTGNLFRVWTQLNSTEDGRKALHGAQKSHVVTNGEDIVTYKDGYQYAKTIQKRVASDIDKFAGRKTHVKKPIVRVRPNGSKRYQAWREFYDASKTNAVKQVTVVHDAATGKDVEVK